MGSRDFVMIDTQNVTNPLKLQIISFLIQHMYLLLRLMSVYTVLVEKEQSEGRVDCIVETPQYVYIFEFKLDGTAAEALQQIEEKGYARPYKADTRQVVKAGVSFSSKSGTIEEWEVRKVSFQNWRID